MIAAGEMRERVELQQRAAGRDSLGQPNGAWSAVATVWAKVEQLRGREWFAAGQMQAETVVRFTIRFRSDIDETFRVVWRNGAHEMTSPPIQVGNNGHREALELMCSRGIRDGR